MQNQFTKQEIEKSLLEWVSLFFKHIDSIEDLLNNDQFFLLICDLFDEGYSDFKDKSESEKIEYIQTQLNVYLPNPIKVDPKSYYEQDTILGNIILRAINAILELNEEIQDILQSVIESINNKKDYSFKGITFLKKSVEPSKPLELEEDFSKRVHEIEEETSSKKLKYTNDLQNEYNTLYDETIELKKKNFDLQQTIDQLQKENQDRNDQFIKYKSFLNETERDLNEKDQKLSQYEEKIQQLNTEKQTYIDKYNQIKGYETEVKELRKRSEQIPLLETKLQAMRLRVQEAQTRDSEMDKLKEKNQELTKQVLEQNELLKKYEVLQTDYDELEKKYASGTIQIHEFELQMNEYKDQIAYKEKELKEKQQQIDHYKESLYEKEFQETKQKALQQLQEDPLLTIQAQGGISELEARNKLLEYESTIHQLEERLNNSSEEQYTQLKKSFREQSKENELLKEKLDSVTKDLYTYKEVLAENIQLTEELQRDLQTYIKDLTQYTDSLNVLQKQNQFLEEDNQKLNLQINDLENQIQIVQEEKEEVYEKSIEFFDSLLSQHQAYVNSRIFDKDRIDHTVQRERERNQELLHSLDLTYQRKLEQVNKEKEELSDIIEKYKGKEKRFRNEYQNCKKKIEELNTQLSDSTNKIKEKDVDLSILTHKYKKEIQLRESYELKIKQYERMKLNPSKQPTLLSLKSPKEDELNLIEICTRQEQELLQYKQKETEKSFSETSSSETTYLNYITKIKRLNEEISQFKIKSYEYKEEKRDLESKIQSLTNKYNHIESKMNAFLLMFQRIKRYMSVGIDLPQRIQKEIDSIEKEYPDV